MPVRTAGQNNKGFTLIEVMVAMLILFISMMALLWSLSMAVEHNLKNLMMDEAVRIVEAQTNTLRGIAFANLSSGSTVVSRGFRNFSVDYTVAWTVQNLSTSNSRSIQVTARWAWKGITHQHSIASIVSTES